LSGSYIRSTLNRGTFATKGSQQSLSLEVAVPGSDLEFYKLNYSGQKYFPIDRNWIFRLSTRLGYGNGYGDTDGLPFFENYYFGGFGTIRGYRQNSLGPQSFPAYGISYGVVDSDNDGIITNGDKGVSAVVTDADGVSQLRENPEDILEDDEFQGYVVTDNSEARAYYRNLSGELPLSILGARDPFGGNVMLQGSAELIFPMPFMKDSRTIRSAFFVDAGNVFSTDCRDTQIGCFSPGLDGMKYSAGIGVNWLSGFGPFNFSIAKTFNHTEIDDREFFQFSLGQQF
jgi:outer membrane protein insertion porin family